MLSTNAVYRFCFGLGMDFLAASQFKDVSRLGKILVAGHSLMVLDVAAIALARLYQPVQNWWLTEGPCVVVSRQSSADALASPPALPPPP